MFRNISTKFTVASVLTAVAAVGIISKEQYLNPDMSTRSTAELQQEAMSLGNNPMIWSLGYTRQDVIVAELTRRFTAQIAVWQVQEAGDESDSPIQTALVPSDFTDNR